MITCPLKRVFLLFCIGFGLAIASGEKERPNIVFLMAEDIGLDLACYGMKGVETPTLDRMAREGRIYKNAISVNPICSPNRSAMMVGMHPNIINAHLHRSNRTIPLPAPYKPITYYLREAGYTCLLGHDLVFEKGRKIDCNFKTQSVGAYDGVTSFGLFDESRNWESGDGPFLLRFNSRRLIGAIGGTGCARLLSLR